VPDGPAPRGRFVDLAGARLWVVDWGTGTPLVCLHGLGGGGHFFSALGPSLASCCQTIAPDMPGSGLSPATGSVSFDAMAALVADLVAREGWQKICLLGHSMGVITALEVMRNASTLVSGFIAVGGLPEPLPGARARITARIAEIQRTGMAGLGPGVAAANMSRRTLEERPELAGLFARLFEMQDIAGYVATADALVRWNARPLPSLTGIPTLVIGGAEDLYAPPEAIRQFGTSLVSDAAVEILDDCGHLPFLEQPAAFAALVEPFLDRRGSARLQSDSI
jgi:pimeloyl-ACP methyl ester carboxylesterase